MDINFVASYNFIINKIYKENELQIQNSGDGITNPDQHTSQRNPPTTGNASTFLRTVLNINDLQNATYMLQVITESKVYNKTFILNKWEK